MFRRGNEKMFSLSVCRSAPAATTAADGSTPTTPTPFTDVCNSTTEDTETAALRGLSQVGLPIKHLLNIMFSCIFHTLKIVVYFIKLEKCAALRVCKSSVRDGYRLASLRMVVF